MKRIFKTGMSLAMLLSAALFMTGCPQPETVTEPTPTPATDTSKVPESVEPGTVGDYFAEYKSAAALSEKLDANNEKVILFYYRSDASYGKWGLWLWPNGGDGQQGYTDTDGKFQYDSETGLAYIVLDSSLLTVGGDALNAIEAGDDLNFIIRDASWNKDPGSDQTMSLSSGNKHYLVMSGNKLVYTVTNDLAKEITVATMTDATTMQVQLSVTYGLDTEASSSGFTLKADDGSTIEIIDAVNSKGKGDRKKNNASDITLTLASSITTDKTWTVSHDDFGSRKVVTAAVVSKVLGDYEYEGNDLGLTLNGSNATFKVWAPTASDVKLLVYASAADVGNFNEKAVENHSAGATTDATLLGTPMEGYPKAMTKNAEGIWSLSDVDVSSAKYYKYQITVAGTTYYVCDLYAKAASPDSIAAQIVDISSDSSAMPASGTETFDGTSANYTNPFTGTKYNDAIIYEMHIRDWSRAVVTDSTGKFLDIANSSEIINHLKDLGITHVQILPMFDYAQVNSDTNYNWGYNPYHYNVPEGRYVKDMVDGTDAVSQMRTMIQALHDAGIAVNMDVVYNHTSGTGTGSLYDSTVPYYYYRMTASGDYSNGSGCGNETNSGAPMFKKYMIDSLKHWMLDYHINGFRFDLMGLHEKTTMQEIYAALSEIDPKVMVYGEPWTGGTSGVKAGATAAAEAGSYGFGAFDDDYRDAVKGKEFGGFKAGQVQAVFDDSHIISGLIGDKTTRNSTTITGLALHYAECHDNFTLYDKLVYSLDLKSAQTADGKGEIATVFPATIDSKDLATVKAQDKLAAAFIILGNGTPFMNGGQEFLRTKKGNPDSYSADKKGGVQWTNTAGEYNIDDVNTIDLTMAETNSDVYNVYKGLIALRKSSTAFTSPTTVKAENIKNTVGNAVKGVTEYICSNGTETYAVYFNATTKRYSARLTVSGKIINVVNGSLEEGESVEKFSEDAGNTYEIPATSFVIIKVSE